MTQYCVGANYTWLLVEGIYLHSLLVLVGRSEEGHFHCYLLLGWGEPRPCPLPGACASDAPTTLLVYLRGSPPLSRLLLPHPGGAVPRVLGLAGPVRALTAAAGLGGGGRGLRRGPRAFRHSLGDRQVPVREHAVSRRGRGGAWEVGGAPRDVGGVCWPRGAVLLAPRGWEGTWWGSEGLGSLERLCSRTPGRGGMRAGPGW